MGFVSGAAYRFINKAYPNYALNVYGTNAASTGRNVCLYINTPSDIMQKWIVTSYHQNDDYGYIMRSAVNQTYILDRSDGSISSSYNNNAHLCAENLTTALDYRVEFVKVENNVYKIVLTGKNLYLTATNTNLNSNNLPASSISSSTALTGGTGGESNVYWAAASSSLKQQWTVSPSVDGSSDPYAALNWRYVFDDSDNAWGYWGYSPTGNSNTKNGGPWVHWGIDVICDTGTPIYAPADATVFEKGFSNSRGNYVVLKMDQVDPVSGRSMYVRFLHMRDEAEVTSGHVSKNDLLGYVGNSGTQTPHLHLDINTQSENQAIVNSFSSAITINPVRFFPNITFPDNYYYEGI